jgi:hypothetical protein
MKINWAILVDQNLVTTVESKTYLGSVERIKFPGWVKFTTRNGRQLGAPNGNWWIKRIRRKEKNADRNAENGKSGPRGLFQF